MYNKEHINVVRIALTQAITYDQINKEQVDEILITLSNKLKEREKFGLLDEYSELMTVKEVSQAIKRCEKTVNRMLQDGRIEGVNKKKGNLILKETVIDWLLED